VPGSRLALLSKVLVITGGPGVGKTTLINAILKVLGAKGIDIALAAPTGRAAKRLSESTGREAKTIHRLLEVDPRHGSFRRNEANPLECSALWRPARKMQRRSPTVSTTTSPYWSPCSAGVTCTRWCQHCMPEIGSQGPRWMRGRSSGWPVHQASPVICSIVCAKPTLSRHGPSSPKAGMRVKIASGFALRIASQPRPKPSITRGEKFSMTMSLSANTSRCTIPCTGESRKLRSSPT